MLRVLLAVRYLPVCVEVAACAALSLDSGVVTGMLHLLAAGAAGLVSLHRIEGADRSAGALASLALVLAMPLVGAAILALVAWPAWARGRQLRARGTIEIALPEVGDESELEAAPEANERRPIRELLGDSPPGTSRVDAVMALRNMEARRAVPLLRLAFSHPSEDVRLLAFAILERREKRLRASIRTLEARLAALGNKEEHARVRAGCHRRLAQHHWELCYGGFVTGDLEIEVLERAAEHARAASNDTADAATALLLARIHLRQRRAAEAWQCLERAERAGAHRGSSVPLFAEAAYALRRFDQIPGLLSRMERRELCRPELEEVAQFWTEPRAT